MLIFGGYLMEPRLITNDILIDSSFLFQESKDAIFILDNNNFVDANPAGLELLRVKSFDELNKSQIFSRIRDQKGQEYTREEFVRYVAGNPHQNKVFQFITKFSFFWVEISNTTYAKDGNRYVFSIWRDITESKQLEAYFKNNEEKLNDALILANTATWEYNPTNHSFVISKGLVDILGLSGKNDNLIQEKYAIPITDYKALIHVDDHPAFIASRNKIKNDLRENDVDHTEYRIVRPDGEVRNLYITTRLTIERNGTFKKFYGTVQDVTEIHQMEGELSKSKEMLSDAFSVANLSTWELNLKTNKMRVGDNFVRLLGEALPIKQGNIVDVTDYISLIHPDDLHTYYLALDRAVKTKESDYTDFVEYRILKPTGEISYIYLSIKVKRDKLNKNIIHYGTIQDITHIRKAVAEKERFGKIIEATSDIVLILDKDMNLSYLNQAAKDFYGFSPEDNVSGFPMKIIQSEHSMKLMKEVILPTVADKGIWNGENLIQRYDKELITVSQVVISHKGFDGEVEYYSSIIRDISKQKEIEQDLLYKNKELDTFVYKASHDLRGPLTSLMGLYAVVENEIKDEKSMEYFNMYNNQIIRLNEIILTLIQLTKIKEIDIKKSSIDFAGIVDSCISSFANLPNFENLKFNIDINVQDDYKSDKGLMMTIIQNLIENAIKYSKPDTEGDVWIKINQNPNDDLIISVEDEGIGIEPEIQGEVFNMFFRVNSNIIGSGLGLYILKNAVQKLNGKVSLISKFNEGTTFVVKLKGN